MQTDGTILLAALCLGIALMGAVIAITGNTRTLVRASLCAVYGVLGIIIAAPLVAAYGGAIYLHYVPLILIALLALPPALYLYVLAKTAPAPRISWLHAVLPAVAGLVCLGYATLPAQAKSAMFITGALPPGLWPATLALLTFALILSWLGVSLAYLAACVRCLRQYRADLRQRYSNLETRDLRWVDWMMALLVILWAAAAASVAADNLGNGPLLQTEVLYGLAACYLIFLTIFAARSPDIPEDNGSTDAPEPKYARSALSREHAVKLAGRIETAMRKDQLYLDPNLSLQKLARHVSAPLNLVSQTLNDELGSSFFDYVGHWRITAAKPLLLTSDASVLTVALDVGFNARSSFYTAFKRETGMTPNAFRKSRSRRATRP